MSSNCSSGKVSAWGFFWLRILFAIPIVGFVFLVVFSFVPGNDTRRSFARSYFCGLAIILIILAIILLISLLSDTAFSITGFLNNIKNAIFGAIGR